MATSYPVARASCPERASRASRAHTCTGIRSAHRALVDTQHQRRLDDFRQRIYLLVPKHGLEQREDTLSRGGVGRECKDDPRNRRNFSQMFRGGVRNLTEINERNIPSFRTKHRAPPNSAQPSYSGKAV